ncbi:hypothetical protein PHLGIDRAFT_42940, partial [Phlebiopsis gigantea 11061_1 CR5-6]
HWNSSMILSVDGRGIPVKYWPDVYKSLGRMKIKPKAWEAIKVEWGNWKLIVEARERYESLEAFWNAFRDDDGSHLGFQAILNILKDKRDEVDNADAQAAVRFFRGNLDHPDAKGAFRYTKTGQSFLLSKPSVIAQRWLAL